MPLHNRGSGDGIAGAGLMVVMVMAMAMAMAMVVLTVHHNRIYDPCEDKCIETKYVESLQRSATEPETIVCIQLRVMVMGTDMRMDAGSCGW